MPCLHTFLKESVQAFHSNNSTTIFLPQAVLYCPPCFPHSDLVAALNSQLVSLIKGPKRLPQQGTMVFFSLPLVPLHNPDSQTYSECDASLGGTRQKRLRVSTRAALLLFSPLSVTTLINSLTLANQLLSEIKTWTMWQWKCWHHIYSYTVKSREIHPNTELTLYSRVKIPHLDCKTNICLLMLLRTKPKLLCGQHILKITTQESKSEGYGAKVNSDS